jgi:hypothetical protein
MVDMVDNGGELNAVDGPAAARNETERRLKKALT